MVGTVKTIARLNALLENAHAALQTGKTEVAERLIVEAHATLQDLVDEMLFHGKWDETEDT